LADFFEAAFFTFLAVFFGADRFAVFLGAFADLKLATSFADFFEAGFFEAFFAAFLTVFFGAVSFAAGAVAVRALAAATRLFAL
jgi:hypothetical protein